MKRNIAAVLADIDGTLVERGKQMNSITTDALNRLHEQGVLFGIASGRPITPQMMRKAEDWHLNFSFDVLIGMNGGQLWDKEHEGIEQMYPLSAEALKDILTLMKPLHRNGFAYEGDHLLVMELDALMQDSVTRNEMRAEVTGYEDVSAMYAHSRNKLLYRMPPEQMAEVLDYLQKQPADERWQYFTTGPGILEFQDPRVNKGTAMKRYAKRNGLAAAQIMTFGDEQNDYELIKDAGIGVCMCNGCEQCRTAADEITEYSAKDGGVGHHLFDHLL